ncbi:MAG: M3 family metallopeptidase [Planctomycetes bacterium]|nr:M3 family metallopeptidase [Planctomycetota bacterium]
MSPTSATSENPLLAPTGIPQFASFQAEHVTPGVQAMLDELKLAQAELESTGTSSWEGVVLPLERIHDRMEYVWGMVSHLTSVRNTPELREAHEAMQPKLIELSMALGQSKAIYDLLKKMEQGADFTNLDAGQQRTVQNLLRDAELSGVALEGETKAEFNRLQEELAALSTKFKNNVLDSTNEFHMDLTTQDEVAGLPPSALGMAASQHPDEDATPENGPWRITLAYPSFGPFLMHGKRRDLREKVFCAFYTRASSGELDNTEVITDILRRRRDVAKLLGFGTYAELSLARKMAPNVAAVDQLLEELRVVSHPAAVKDFAELQAFAGENGQTEELERWDLGFWTERMQEKLFDYSDEDLRPYFPLPKVLEGLFGLATRLFGVTVKQVDNKVDVWHPDVLYFEISDNEGAPMAAFFLDPFTRSADKRGGAWMNGCLGRTNAFGEVRLPVAYLVCNFTPPVGEKPALLSFGEVETLFHEFGHGLQHMLTKIEHGMVSGIENVDWDAVELPSQFMENWCYDKPTLMGFSGHWETGEPLPDDLFAKLLEARTFRSGSVLVRQVGLSVTDLELHHSYDPDGDETPNDVASRLRKTTAVGPDFAGDRFLCAFSHIFAGGYAAGYYSYKWAEVLSADAFAAFEEAGLDNEEAVAATGRKFADTVLGLGGSLPPMEVFKAFRGREPSTAALLKHSGLV